MTGGTEYLRATDIARLTGMSTPNRPALDRRRDPPLDQARRRQARGKGDLEACFHPSTEGTEERVMADEEDE